MAEQDQDQDQKTEQPSSKRLTEARERGQVPISRETAKWVSMLTILVVLAWFIPPMMSQLTVTLRELFESPHAYALDDEGLKALLMRLFGEIAMASGVSFAILAAGIVAGTMVQTGFFFALDLLTPDFSRLIPSKGLKRLFSPESLVELARGMGKLLFLGAIAYSVVEPVATQAPAFIGMPLFSIFGFLQHTIIHLMTVILVGFTIIAAADLFYIRYTYIKNLKMTKTEVKDEFKQQEGDPAIKARLRQMRADKARKRMMAQVPKADVIITNPTHYAVALQYDGLNMAAPVVLAKGINLIAERIRDLADEHRIPLVSNPPLARALYDTVEIDQQIPVQHYRAVAEVISYVYKLRKRKY